MYRHCPECKEDWNGKVCTACGYKTKQTVDLDNRLCSDIQNGQRCSKAGVVSPLTLNGGKDGTEPVHWYCWDHVPGQRAFREGQEVCPPPMGFAALRAKLQPKRIDAETALERLAIAQEPPASP